MLVEVQVVIRRLLILVCIYAVGRGVMWLPHGNKAGEHVARTLAERVGHSVDVLHESRVLLLQVFSHLVPAVPPPLHSYLRFSHIVE